MFVLSCVCLRWRVLGFRFSAFGRTAGLGYGVSGFSDTETLVFGLMLWIRVSVLGIWCSLWLFSGLGVFGFVLCLVVSGLTGFLICLTLWVWVLFSVGVVQCRFQFSVFCLS